MEKALYFICADDEFIADNRARELFAELSKDISDDMSKEIVQGSANNAADALKVCANTLESARTLSLFGGKKVVWLRALNFLNDSNGRSKDTQAALEELAQACANLNPQEVALVISASPVDKRKKAFKTFKENSNFEYFESESAQEACMQLLKIEAEKLGVEISREAVDALISTVAANPRMAIQELNKLATYKGFKGKIEKSDVGELVPIFGESDFFELTSMFYAGNISAALSAIRRFFFSNKNASARPIISSLQKQNSMLIQIRALMDGGKLPKSERMPRGAFEELAGEYAPVYKSAEKSPYNIFSQNPWYMSRLAAIAARIPQRKLIDMQLKFAKAFEDLIARPNSDEDIVKELFISASVL